ncbi:MAG: Clp protease N-terminal domain-containing protein, partial [Actinomycetes bacterium]
MDLTTRSQEAIASAQRAAVAAGNPSLEPAHLLDALLEQPDGIALALLDAVGADRASLRADASAEVQRLPRASGSTVAGPQASGALQRVLALATERATSRGDAYLSTEHLLLG